ncbi:MAG: (2Fe-2S)-binding protein [Piscirickettsiaceae bacterium]|nr:MAG: (2Fe-2S)-binding protein [Piscirickettsiaceae bacterium]PCI71806.1 MAG: (2Fe-2S)-binding protein [Piscirickettsiaceae bacterium]
MTSNLDNLVQAGRVHRTVYTDEEIFLLEQQKVFGETWVYLAHASEIKEPNSFVARKMGLRSVIVTRDKEQKIHVLLNRCTHRGATVCREKKGDKTPFFTCPYHGWTFRNTGECAAIPHEDAYGTDFDKSSFNLKRIPYVSEYRGFIFATLNPKKGKKGIKDHLKSAADRIDEWIDHNGGDHNAIRISGAQQYTVHANWKCLYDNAGDGYHPEFSHQSLLQMTQQRYGSGMDLDYFSGGIDSTPMYSQDIGNGHTFLDQRPCMYEASAFDRQRPQPGREAIVEQLTAEVDEDKARDYFEMATGAGMNLNIFPNLLFIGNQLQVITPLSVGLSDMTWYSTTIDNVPAAVNTLRLRTQEDFTAFGEPDDTANFEACFKGMHEREIDWIDISRHLETGVDTTDENGVVTSVISSDIHMRAYYAEWKKLMQSNDESSLG